MGKKYRAEVTRSGETAQLVCQQHQQWDCNRQPQQDIQKAFSGCRGAGHGGEERNQKGADETMRMSPCEQRDQVG